MKPVFQWVYATDPRQVKAAQPPVNRASDAVISDRIEQAFDVASQTTGTSFDYLLRTAQRESALDPAAKARTSSATGLFQFIEGTWLETMKLAGPELGFGDLAARIEKTPDGRYVVADPDDRRAILDLRKDPEVASMMAGALTRRNAAFLSERLGRDPSAGELYIAHFLGAGGAAKLIRLAETRPDASAADHFPKQAAANRPIFYQRGEARSASAVYAELVESHGGIDLPAPSAMMAYAPLPASGQGEEAVAAAEAASRVAEGWRAARPADTFTALFRNDHPELHAAAASAFFQGYAVAPALFDVAAAEDTRLLDEEEKARRAAREAEAAAASPSLAGRGAAPRGPLDLSRFLKVQEG